MRYIRDVTRALDLVAKLRASAVPTDGQVAVINELEEILRAMDARTGSRDPSLREPHG
jgi:hypothetical protein